ncbi:Homeodomain transcription factor [Favolaschia claudopus]|uniref:Homeodomain transcription factor n=1 Tax=Favolaschia claudopus TaxID=2862362 RepID=A0AAW0EDR6_9AGAR
MPPLKSPLDKVKKPRHRHSAAQLAALNAVYEETEHPTLAQRTALAQSQGLEIKSVNAYFQNKRASAKKQPRGSPYDAPQRVSDDDHYHLLAEGAPFPSALLPNQHSRQSSSLNYPPHLFPDSAMDANPTPFQVDELRRIYRINPYPTIDEARFVAQRIGMRYQTIIDWFRTQRNLDRGSIDQYPPTAAAAAESFPPISSPPNPRHSHLYPILPPISTLPPAASHPSLLNRRYPPPPPVPEDHYYAIHNDDRRSPSPYNTTSPFRTRDNHTALSSFSTTTRPRRGRPDTFQLNSLRRLLSKTPTPSLEERSALAVEIGMDLGKVTNWFRNLRQSARKRERGKPHRAGFSDDDDNDEMEYNEPVYLSSTSRSPSETPRTSSVERDSMSSTGSRRLMHSSDEEEDLQEALTPSSSPAASPFRARPLELDEKPAANMYSGSVPYEDALLLLSFHRQAAVV